MIYEIIIIGGGLAGMALAIQLKQAQPELAILILEKREGEITTSTYKVGEAISEMGSYYLREILGLKSYLTNKQLPKFGFRFFLSPNHRDDIAHRVEVASKTDKPFPSHHIDRARLENEMVRILKEMEVNFIWGAKVTDIEFGKKEHLVQFEKEGILFEHRCKWVVDSSGRRAFLKRKLGLEKKLDHHVNAAWFRMDQNIDIGLWSDDKSWKSSANPGRRRLCTNHLMGKGYWVWIIPLVSDKTSIGIVADPSIHPIEGFHTLSKAMEWLAKHEPQAARILGKHTDSLIDFRIMKHLAHDTQQFYSTDRWGLTGDAGTFMDPFYSPGIDFIGLNNSWLTELITCDLKGENIKLRSMIYELTQRELINGWIEIYKNKYALFGSTQVMIMKVVWDWSTYWGITSLMFMNKGYTDIRTLKLYSSSRQRLGRRFSELNQRMQALFQAWAKIGTPPLSDNLVNVMTLSYLHRFHLELHEPIALPELIPRISFNLDILEKAAAEIFRLVSAQVHGTPHNLKIDPYTMAITDTKEVLLEKSKGDQALFVDDVIQSEMQKIWLTPEKKSQNEHSY